jgi:hypothetical protein
MNELGIPTSSLPSWVGGTHPGVPMFDIVLRIIKECTFSEYS